MRHHTEGTSEVDRDTGVVRKKEEVVEINQYLAFKTGDGEDELRVPLSSDNFIEASVGNVGTWALVDTGAQVSCLRRDLWQRLKTPLLPNDRTFRTASGSSMPIVGRYTIDLGVVGRTVKLECYVSEQLNHGLILGADFLQQNQAIIDYSKSHKHKLKG